jgi:hypothetical protein
MRYKPSILENIKYWQVFEDDQHIKKFMEVIDEFENTQIDSYGEEETKQMVGEETKSIPEFNDNMAEHKFPQLMNDLIPKRMVPLEQLFDRNDVPVKPTILPKDDNTEDCNIGT